MYLAEWEPQATRSHICRGFPWGSWGKYLGPNPQDITWLKRLLNGKIPFYTVDVTNVLNDHIERGVGHGGPLQSRPTHMK